MALISLWIMQYEKMRRRRREVRDTKRRAKLDNKSQPSFNVCNVQYVSAVKYEKRQLYLILPMCFAPSICRRNNSSRLHGTEQYNYGNMKVNERIADVKLPRNLWAFLSELFIKRCAPELKAAIKVTQLCALEWMQTQWSGCEEL